MNIRSLMVHFFSLFLYILILLFIQNREMIIPFLLLLLGLRMGAVDEWARVAYYKSVTQFLVNIFKLLYLLFILEFYFPYFIFFVQRCDHRASKCNPPGYLCRKLRDAGENPLMLFNTLTFCVLLISFINIVDLHNIVLHGEVF